MFNWIMKWIGKIREWLTLADSVVAWGEDNYPGLLEVIMPLINYTWDMVGKGNMTKSEAREWAVGEAKEQLRGSPRFVPEWVIRIFIEAIVGKMKHMKLGPSYYDKEEVMRHAHEVLSGRRGGPWGG